MNDARFSVLGTERARCRNGRVRRTSTRLASYRRP